MLQLDDESQSLKESFRETLKFMRNYKHQETFSVDLSDVFEIWKKVFLRNVRIYSIISHELFNKEIDDFHDQDFDTLARNISLLGQFPFEPEERIDEWENFLWKIDDHIELVRVQISKINDNSRLAESSLGIIGTHLNKINDENNKKYKRLEGKQRKLLEQSKNAQKDFISILGIFASILIAAFGGITSLSSLFKKIDSVSTGKLILMGSFETLAIILIIFLLLNGIAKLTDLNLKSCGCKPEDDCKCNVARKHPSLFILTVVLLLTSLFGASEYVIDYPKLLGKMGDGITLLVVIIIAIFIAVCSFIYFNDTKRKLKSS
ncbi:hypothetical protein [Rummeliibacillus sp. BSL5]